MLEFHAPRIFLKVFDALPPLRLTLLSIAVSAVALISSSYVSVNVNQAEDLLLQFANVSIREHYGTKVDKLALLSIWGFAVSGGGLFGILACLVAYPIMNRFGCRASLLLLTNFLLLITALLGGISKATGSFELFVLSQFTGSGLGWTLAFIYAPIYLTELSPPAARGCIGMIVSIGFYVGLLLAFGLGLPNVLATDTLWPVYLGWTAAISLLGMFLYFVCPDTPKAVFEKDERKAREIVRKYYGKAYPVEQAMADFREEAAQARSPQGGRFTVRRIFTDRHLRQPLILGTAAWLFASSSGSAILLFFSTSIFENLGIPSGLIQLSTFLIAAPLPLFAVVAAVVVDRVGRRPLVVGVGGAQIIALVVYVLFGLLAAHFVSSDWLRYVALAALLANSWMMPFGPFSVAVFLTAELLPQEARHVGTAIALLICNVEFVVLVQLFPILLEATGPWSFLILLVAPSAIFWLVLWKWLPETKGKAVNEIVRLWTSSNTLRARLSAQHISIGAA